MCCCAFIGGYMCAVVHLWKVICVCSFAFLGG